MLRVTSPGFSGGSNYQISWLVQWICRAVEPETAAGVDAATLQSARKLVEKVGSENQREIARLCGRLEGYKRLAESTTAEGERENAERKFGEARSALRELLSAEPRGSPPWSAW